MALVSRVGLLLAGVLASACFAPGEGIEPPLDRVYFPVALVLDEDRSHLLVVNSDFDLQFNGGTVQSLDLVRLRGLIPRDGTCGALRERSPEGQVVVPGRCGSVDLENPPGDGGSLITDAVGIGAFATDALFRARPPDADGGKPGRLYIPVRGDTTLHFIDVDGGTLECGQAGNEGDCDDAHRRGDDPDQENTRNLRLPPEPFGIAASESGQAIAVTHQTEGAASLFVQKPAEWSTGPRLEFVVGSMPDRPTGIVGVPEPAVVAEGQLDFQPAFLITFRNAAEIRLLRFYDDRFSEPQRPFLDSTNRTTINTNSAGFDSRGIAIDSSARDAAEAACASIADPALRLDCLRRAAAVPLGVYVANRTPSTLIIGETRTNLSPTSSDDLPQFFDTLPLDFGPSRVILGDVITPAGVPEKRIFVVCFDARVIYVYDPGSRRIETQIETGRGPHSLAIDVVVGPTPAETHAWAYVGHFTDSYIGVIGLDQRNIAEYGKMVLTVSQPTPPRASK